MSKPIPVVKVGDSGSILPAMILGGGMALSLFIIMYYNEVFFSFTQRLGLSYMSASIGLFLSVGIFSSLASKLVIQSHSETVQVTNDSLLFTPPTKKTGAPQSQFLKTDIDEIIFTFVRRQPHDHQQTQYHTYYRFELVSPKREPGIEYRYELGNAWYARQLQKELEEAGYPVSGDRIGIGGFVIKIIALVVGVLFTIVSFLQ